VLSEGVEGQQEVSSFLTGDRWYLWGLLGGSLGVHGQYKCHVWVGGKVENQ